MTLGRFILAGLISLAVTGTPHPAFRPVAGSPFPAGPEPTAVAFSPNGGLLAVADYSLGAVSVYSVSASGRLRRVPGSPFPTGTGPLALAFSPSGHTLAVADYGANELTLDAVGATGELTPAPGSPRALAGPPYDVTYSPDGRIIATADSTGDAIQLIDARDSSPATATQALAAGSDPTSLAFSPNGALLAVAEHGTDQIAAYSLSFSGPLPALTSLAGSPLSTAGAADTVSFNREGDEIAASDYNADQINLLSASPSAGLSVAAGSPISTGPASGPDSAVFSPVSDRLAVALGTANETALYGVSPTAGPFPLSGSPLPAGTGPAAAAFNSQGTLLATANIYSNSVSLYASTAPPPVVVRLLSHRARLRDGRVQVRLTCAGVVDRAPGHVCRGHVTLSRAGKRAVSTAFRLNPGDGGRVTLSLPLTVRELIRRDRHLTITETVSAAGARKLSQTLSVSR